MSLPGLPVGGEAIVNSEDPYMASCLQTQLLVPIPEPEEENEE